MSNLLSNGFHIGEVTEFLSRSELMPEVFVEKMREGLANGETLAKILEQLNFSSSVVTQIGLAEQHGDLCGTLKLVEQNVRKSLSVQKKLIGVMLYPLILIGLLVGIMLGLKNYLLPQISDGSSNFATSLITHFPIFFLISSVMILLLIVMSRLLLKNKSAVFGACLWSKIPILSSYILLFQTGYFAREWGNLIAQGVELNLIFKIMGQQTNPLFREVGEFLSKKLNAGESFESSVSQLSFFNHELALMIEYGELKDKLGLELGIYADECWEQFFIKIDRAIQFIQPLVFVFIALMIILLYAAMLLPIYSNMNKMI
ncbi:competence type IV pilus assembly protein ComGB [Lactococcus fujiensis]|nr:competence type IV pilus assembly protein ComGB [Lactococcus fujiensis]